MKAVVYHDTEDIRLDDVPDPGVQDPTDAVVRITTSAICGTDLHMVRGTMPGMKPGTILGHEGVGIIEDLGPDVRNLRVGDRVVIPSTIGCGSCSYCRAGYYAQCDTANPNGPQAGTAFFGGPESTGAFDGLQAEAARIPFAHANLVKLPDDVGDDDGIILSDIFPTGWFAADLANIHQGHTVAVFGCGIVGQLAIMSAQLMGAGRVLAIDTVPSRLETARGQGAEVVDYGAEDPVEAVRRLTGGIGPDRVIDAVGVDAEPDTTQALEWAVQCVAKAGTLAIVGVYPPEVQSFPIGQAMQKNLSINSGNCNHRRYLPHLVELVRTGAAEPGRLVTQIEGVTRAVEAFETFSNREEGWLKVALDPAA